MFDYKFVFFLIFVVMGLLVFILVDGFGIYFDNIVGKIVEIGVKGGLGVFFYFEVLDVSFLFDGVIGVFVLIVNILLIVIGLGIGVMYVWFMIIMFVECGMLVEF